MPYKDPKHNRDYQREYQKKWNQNHPEKRQEISRKADKKRYRSPTRKLAARTAHQRKLIRARLKVFEMYGKKCAWCGEDRFELLSIDHINDDGKQHRKQMHGWNSYEWLAKQPYQPDKLQTLCHNCNSAKQYFDIKPGEVDYMPWEYWESISKLRKRGKDE